MTYRPIYKPYRGFRKRLRPHSHRDKAYVELLEQLGFSKSQIEAVLREHPKQQ